jgi:precorrin-6B methylase 2
MSELQPPSPALLFEAVNAYQRTAAIKAAVELGLFTAIAEGHATPEALAAPCQASERGVRILCDYLTILGFLEKQENNYTLTPSSAVFLNRHSPAYTGGIIDFLLSPAIVAGFDTLTEAVRQGGTAIPAEGTVAPENPVWVQFARAMMPMMAMPAQQIASLVPCDPEKPLKVLDIAAGHGLFGIAFAQRYPQAQVHALDWPQVLEVASQNAAQAGVGDRHHALPGSAFEVEYGTGYDLVLLTNFLHHFDVPTCETLLRKVHASLAEGGRVVTLEFIPNADRVSPPMAASFSLTMLASTPSGDAYTFAELDSMLRSAGFSRNEEHALPPFEGKIIVSQK